MPALATRESVGRIYMYVYVVLLSAMCGSWFRRNQNDIDLDPMHIDIDINISILEFKICQ